MMMALSDSFPEWVQAYVDLATIARQGARGRITATGYKSPLEAYLAKWRQHLYSLEKELGDIVVIPGVGIPGVSGLRENLLGAARVIGDLQAVMGSAIGARFTRRLTGKVTGRAIGIGSRTIFANKVYVAGPISFGNRIYNRMAGKYASKYTRLGGL